MKRFGKYILLLGLILGLLTGFGLIVVENYVAGQLFTLLEDEIKESCDCSFEVDDIDFSIITLSAKATNARIIENKRERLNFKKIKLTLGLKDINKKKIYINRLDLMDGVATGVRPKSPTFKLIDHLSTPSPPDPNNEDKWKLKLLGLKVLNSTIIEEFTKTKLQADMVNMDLRRTPDNHFVLKPRIGELKVIGEKSTTQIGTFQSLIDLIKGDIIYKSLEGHLGQSTLTAEGKSVAPDHQLDANADLNIFSKDYQLRFIDTQVKGSAKIAGTYDDPLIQGKLTEVKDYKHILKINNLDFLPITDIDSNYEVKEIAEKLTVIFKTLNMRNSGSTIRVAEPITIDSEQITGSLKFSIGSVEYDQIKYTGANGTLRLSGDPVYPDLDITGNINKINVHDFIFNNTNYKFNRTDNIYQVDLSHRGEEGASMFMNAKIKADINYLDDLKFSFNNYHFEPSQIDYIEELRISGSGNLKGRLKAAKVHGEGKLSLSSRFFAGESALDGDFSIAKGKIQVNLNNPSQSIKTILKYNVRETGKGFLSLDLNEFNLREYNPDLDCAQVTLSTDYTFRTRDILAGSGDLSLSKLVLGCEPTILTLSKPQKLKIDSGDIKNINLQLDGPSSKIHVSGSVSSKKGVNISSETHVELETFTKFLPWLDDLRGNLNAKFTARGPFDSMHLTGSAELKDAEFAMAETGLEGNGFKGKLFLDKELIVIEDLSGLINGAPISLTGTANPFHLEKSNLDLIYEEFQFIPNDELILNTSGIFNFSPNEEDRFTLTGELIVNDAVFQKELGLKTTINLVQKFFNPEQASSLQARLPDLDLQLSVRANRNIFIITDILESELQAQLDISGSLQNPIVTGHLDTLYGWFGLRNGKFNITSGKIQFAPHQLEPDIDLLAETNVINNVGEPVYIILEAQGKLTNPRISMVADSNLSEQELLTLLTTRGAYRTRTQASTLTSQSISKIAEKKDEDQTILGKLLLGLTEVDTFTIEPAYNYTSGLIEPSFIAEKKLTRSVRLTSDSFIGGSNNDTRFRASYDYNRYVTFVGSVDTASTQENTALEFNTSFTLLSKRSPNLKINLYGDYDFSELDLLDALRISEESLIQAGEILQIQNNAITWMVNQGYLDAHAEATCEVKDEHCNVLSISLEPGNEYKVEEIVFTEDTLPKSIKIKTFKSGKQTASKSFLEQANKDLISVLRSEGYLQSRVQSEYLLTPDNTVQLLIQLRLGTPVSFNFIGNKVFTERELLDTIKIFERSQPFGNNTIYILIENIERLYRKESYIYATFDFQESFDYENNRLVYTIYINEEEPVENYLVNFQGLSKLEFETLKEHVEVDHPIIFDDLFYPDQAIAEDIETYLIYLVDYYRELGYQNVDITYRLEPQENGKVVQIQYTIKKDDLFTFEDIQVNQYPENVTPPLKPEQPLSIPKVNRYIDIVLDQLSQNGYLQPAINTSFDDTGSTVIITPEIDQYTLINSIDCKGSVKISCEEIIARTGLQPGERYSREKVNRARSKLLKQGLYQSVFIDALDRRIDSESEDLIIQVTERPFQTLDVGAGVNSELGTHVFSEATDRGLFKDGKTISLSLDAYYKLDQSEVTRGVAGLRYQDPALFDTGVKYTQALTFQKYDNPTLEYDLDRVSVDSSFQYSRHKVSSTIGYTYLFDQLENVTPGAVRSDLDTGDVDLGFIYGSLSYDLRDEPLSPKKGMFIGLDYKFASDALGSDANFYGVNGRLSWIVPIYRQLSIANNTFGGASWTFDDTTEIPITQRYYLGGRTSIRGFRENSLGPRAEDDAVIGGDSVIGNNFELRYLVANNLSIHTFFDFGTVFLRDIGVNSSEVRESAGVGFRYVSPIGPIGLDLGMPLDERDGEPSTRVHFSVGSAF